jgi:site-specific recombinase
VGGWACSVISYAMYSVGRAASAAWAGAVACSVDLLACLVSSGAARLLNDSLSVDAQAARPLGGAISYILVRESNRVICGLI